MSSFLRTGLNPYGLAYHLGIQGHSTPRANPHPASLDDYIGLASELGARTLEIWEGWTRAMSDAELKALGDRLRGLGMEPVASTRLFQAELDKSLAIAAGLGATIIRFALTPILCGDRHAAGRDWYDLVQQTWDRLATLAPKAADRGLTIVIENHQDFTSRELVAFCTETGPNVGIVFDTANTFPTAESPLDFARTIAPYVRYLHLKDYRVQTTTEGIRLVRCPTGDGAVPFAELLAVLGEHNDTLPAAIEIGALDARHVRFFTPDWWHGYAPKPAEDFAACLLAAQRNRLPDDADYRTPWEKGEDAAVAAYELAQVRRSAENLRAMGLMPAKT